jgi:MinD superfamily P-loop ATPase
VISSLSGADFVVLVTEPTVSGLHDLTRAYRLVTKFKVRAGCIINKSDLNVRITEKIETFLHAEGIVHLASLPYDESFTESMTKGETIVEYSANHLTDMIVNGWNKILKSL